MPKNTNDSAHSGERAPIGAPNHPENDPSFAFVRENWPDLADEDKAHVVNVVRRAMLRRQVARGETP